MRPPSSRRRRSSSSPRCRTITVTAAAMPCQSHICGPPCISSAWSGVPDIVSGAMSPCAPCVPGFAAWSVPDGVPSWNSRWNRSWLAATETDRRGSESRRATSAVQTGSESTQGTRTPSQLGRPPPPARWEARATRVAADAARTPRTPRAVPRPASGAFIGLFPLVTVTRRTPGYGSPRANGKSGTCLAEVGAVTSVAPRSTQPAGSRPAAWRAALTNATRTLSQPSR